MTICKNYYNRDENGGLDFTVHTTISALTSKEMEVLGLLNERFECVRIECDLDSGIWAVRGPVYADNRPVLLMAASSLVSRGLLEERISACETSRGEYYAARHWLDLTEKGVQVLAELYNLGRFYMETKEYRARVGEIGSKPVSGALELYTKKVIKLAEMVECPDLSERAVAQMREEIDLCREVVACLRAAVDSQTRGRSIGLARPFGRPFGRQPARDTWALASRVYAEFGSEYGVSRPR
jgi:hypothetical protein